MTAQGVLYLVLGLLFTYLALLEGREVACIRWRRLTRMGLECKRRVEARFGKFKYSEKGH